MTEFQKGFQIGFWVGFVVTLITAILTILWDSNAWPCDVCEEQNRICMEFLEKHPEVKRCDAWRYEWACYRIHFDENENPCYLEAFENEDYRSRVTADPEPMFNTR